MPTILAAPVFTTLEETVTQVSLELDFSRYDAYLQDIGVLFLNDGQSRKATVTIPLRAPKTDIGETRFEARPDYGDFYAQGDFSHGAGQRYFHRPTRDEAKFLKSEGFDVSEPGLLHHLPDVDYLDAGASGWSAPTALIHSNSALFFVGGTKVVKSSAFDPEGGSVTWAQEDPHAGEGAVEPLDLTTSGDIVYAALGANGVHERSTLGIWTHTQPDGATDLDVGDATVVQWAKDRLIVVGNGGSDIYEVVADSTPTSLETLAPGWSFVDIFEHGAFIFAVAANAEIGQSRVHAFGLNSGGTALEKKAATSLPKGDVARCGASNVGRAFVAGGRGNDSNFDPFIYEVAATDTGELSFSLIADEGDVEIDGSVYGIVATRDSVVFGWTDGDRTGLARYNLARNAFSYDLSAESAYLAASVLSPGSVTSVTEFEGRLLFSTSDNLVLWDDSPNRVTTATLTASLADWNNFGLKAWDLFAIRHSALLVNDSVLVEYSEKQPEDEEFFTGVLSDIPGATGAEERVEDIRSRSLVARLTSTAGAATATPSIQGFSVRSNPSPANADWQLIRTVRVLDRDRKDRNAESVLQDPRNVRDHIENLIYDWITVYEPGVTWIARIESIAEVEPASTMVSESLGTSEREAFYLELRMTGRKAI